MSTPDADQVTDIHVTEVDGVPTVWAPLPGPFRAGLMLRVGTSDETLARLGHTHMLEHLALYGLQRPGDHLNGQVDATTLAVHVTADPQDAATFLERAARQLADPPLSRLEDEKGVLRAEQASRAPSPFRAVLAWRWGAAGYALEGSEEYGLYGMTPDDVRAWASAWVSRRNAVLWLTGPPPAGLRVALPDGEPRPHVDPRATPLPAFPTFFRSDAPIAVTHGLVRRSAAAVALAGVMRTRLLDDLRVQRAAAYSPDVAYRPLDGSTAAVLTYSDIVQGHAPEVFRRLVETVDELTWSDRTATQEELAAHRTLARRALAASDGNLVAPAAWNLLHGAPVQTTEEVLAELDGVTPDDVRAAATELKGTLLAQLPPRAYAPPGWNAAPLGAAEPVTGGSSHLHLGVRGRLRVAPEGVTVSDPTGSLTVRSDHVAALLAWEDGGRRLIANDGNQLVVEPTVWRRGRRAVELVDAAVAPERVVPMGPRAPERVPRVGPWARLGRLVTAPTTLVVVAVAVIAALGVAARHATQTGQGGLIAVPGLVGLLVVARNLLTARDRP